MAGPSSIDIVALRAGYLGYDRKNGRVTYTTPNRSDGSITTWHQMWTLKPDLSGIRALYQSYDFWGPQGAPGGTVRNVGNVSFHPTRDWAVVQVQRYVAGDATPLVGTQAGQGFHNDLKFIRTDGIEQVIDARAYDASARLGCLQPHWNNAGDKIVWAEMVTAASIPLGRPYASWIICVGAVTFDGSGNPAMGAVTTYDPSQSPAGTHFYECHGFTPDDSQIVYTTNHRAADPGATQGQFDICQMFLSNQKVTILTVNNFWEEHAHYNPAGTKLISCSARDVPASFTGFPVLDVWEADAPTCIDPFERADSASAPGSTQFGALAWTVLSGTWGINTGQLYASAVAGMVYAVVNSGKSTGTIITNDFKWATGQSGGVVFRGDGTTNNLWSITSDGTTWTVAKIVAGASTPVQTAAQALTNGTTYNLRVTLTPTGFDWHVDGVQKGKVADTALLANTRHGAAANGTSIRFDNFAVFGDFARLTAVSDNQSPHNRVLLGPNTVGFCLAQPIWVSNSEVWVGCIDKPQTDPQAGSGPILRIRGVDVAGTRYQVARTAVARTPTTRTTVIRAAVG